MIPLGPEPSIYYVLTKLALEGFEEVVLVVRGSSRNQITDYVGDGSKFGVKVSYEVEPDGLRIGTAGSLRLGEHLLDETFLVAQADTLTEIPLRDAVKFHQETRATATIVLTRVHDPSDYGVAVLDGRNTITEFQEKPSREEARSNLVSTGFYVLEPEAVDYIMDEKWDFAKDLFPSLLRFRKKLSGFASSPFWVDIGNLEGYLRGVRWVIDTATKPGDMLATGLHNPVMTDKTARIGSRALVVGPTLIEREVRVEDEAKIGQYCVVKRNSQISSGSVLERSAIMERVVIGSNCTIIDSVIGESAIIHGSVTITDSIVGPGCVIGDRATLLKGGRIWPNVMIMQDEMVEGIVATPLETAFYCYTNFGQYTGLLATSIEGFIDALEKSPIESVEFHAKRRDYEKWVRSVLSLNELADGIEDLRRMGLTGEDLRRDLIEVTRKWADAIESKNQPVLIAED